MSLLPFDVLPVWARLLSLALNLLVGAGLGAIHFGGLRRAAEMITGERSVLRILGLLIGRWVLLGAGLALGAVQGGGPVVVMALGVLVARHVIVRRAKAVAS
ncbi:hypothetical protein BH11PSE1_BH11PSE1_13110 [soil metagenome]